MRETIQELEKLNLLTPKMYKNMKFMTATAIQCVLLGAKEMIEEEKPISEIKAYLEKYLEQKSRYQHNTFMNNFLRELEI